MAYAHPDRKRFTATLVEPGFDSIVTAAYFLLTNDLGRRLHEVVQLRDDEGVCDSFERWQGAVRDFCHVWLVKDRDRFIGIIVVQYRLDSAADFHFAARTCISKKAIIHCSHTVFPAILRHVGKLVDVLFCNIPEAMPGLIGLAERCGFRDTGKSEEGYFYGRRTLTQSTGSPACCASGDERIGERSGCGGSGETAADKEVQS